MQHRTFVCVKDLLVVFRIVARCGHIVLEYHQLNIFL